MLWTWTLVAGVGVGLAALGAGLWWALADFLLDVGATPVTDWDGGSHDDVPGGTAATPST
jgi:hypothetical protein